MSEIAEVLEERGSRYGDFGTHAYITQDLKTTMQLTRNWQLLSDSMKESLEMIAHKIGRILNGDPYYRDSWTDIVGYAKLVDQELEKEENEAKEYSNWVAYEPSDGYKVPGLTDKDSLQAQLAANKGRNKRNTKGRS